MYSRRSFGYSPSNACFKNVDARKTVAKTKQKDVVLVGQIEIPVKIIPKLLYTALHRTYTDMQCFWGNFVLSSKQLYYNVPTIVSEKYSLHVHVAQVWLVCGVLRTN